MRLADFDLKSKIYLAIVVLLFVLTEWVNGIAAGVRAIALFLKGVI